MNKIFVHDYQNSPVTLDAKVREEARAWPIAWWLKIRELFRWSH